ncbi:MAG: S1 RNA-binding domain-containing protein [Clostridia bacterium]|nr:S1 RNA-binding domain-containing protein [Clostridia bacterium]
MAVQIGDVCKGKVTKLMNFGAFVRLESGDTGMVHISEVSHTYVNDIGDYLAEGQEVDVKVIGVNEQGKISLSIKQTQPKPEPGQKPVKPKRPPRQGWQGLKPKETDNLSFEDMMSRFKSVSEEKISDLKRATDSKHSGYSRRGR